MDNVGGFRLPSVVQASFKFVGGIDVVRAGGGGDSVPVYGVDEGDVQL